VYNGTYETLYINVYKVGDKMPKRPYATKTKREQKTYPQDWPSYNLCQTQEKIFFIHLLRELVEIIPTKKEKRKGRPPMSIQEMIFSICLMLYGSKSSRRTISELEIAKQLKYINKKPHFNTILKYLRKKELTPILKDLITISSIPLKQFEEHFAVDASGFSTSQHVRWTDFKWGKKQTGYLNIWRKAHIMCGVKTNVITAIEITKRTTHDNKCFLPLLKKTNKHFDIEEVSADKAYCSKYNFKIIAQLGATPFIPFKKDASPRRGGSFVWRRMLQLFREHYDEWAKHYHLRSNVETVFSMMKRKFNTKLRTFNEASQTNEILCMALCHNLCVLIQEYFELGASIDFSLCAKRYASNK